jgi:sulfur-carrier protein
MKLTVKLFAYFRDNRFVAEVKDYPERTTVAEIIADLGIDEQEVGVTMLNSRHCRLDARPQENDILAVFPVIGGG